MLIYIFYIIAGIIAASLLTLIIYVLIPFQRPSLSESDYSHAVFPWWELYYGHKYVHPRFKAEKGSGLEEYFANMKFDFDKSPLNESKRIKIKMTGDLMERKDLLGKGGEQLWDEAGAFMFDADIVLGNLEFAINEDEVWEELLRFSVPPEYLTPLIEDGRFGRFDAVALANNHINDSSKAGIIKTIEHLDKVQLKHSGAARSPEEQDEFPIFEVNGIKVAFLSYTFSTNGRPLAEGFEYGTNIVRFNALNEKDYDPSIIHRHIRLAKERGADFIISSHHWGMDHECYPQSRMLPRAHELMEAGIDIIMGHHPHVLNPVEHYKTKDGRDTLIFYSLGNLTAHGLKFAMRKMSAIAGIELEAGIDAQGNKRVRPVKVELMPLYHSKVKKGGVLNNRVLRIIKGNERIKSASYEKGYYSFVDKFRIQKLYQVYKKLFMQDGIEHI